MVIEMRECAFRRQLRDNKELHEYVNNHAIACNLPLQPRDSFFGGRTGNVKLYHKVDSSADEKIKYVDVCSLYPWVCKYGKYPVGHPKIIEGGGCNALLGNDNCIYGIEGLNKYIILLPHNLFHSVLPRKVHNKLMFALCRTCCDNLFTGNCSHAVEERQFVGTYVVDELRRAVQLGYEIIEVYEIWQYEVTVYDRSTASGGLFTDYIDTFLKMKQESSDFPLECITDEQRRMYIDQYWIKEGIQLDPTRIENNEAADHRLN